MDRLFDQYLETFFGRDMARLNEIISDEAVVWHSLDGRTKNKNEYIEFITGMPKGASTFSDVRREYFEDGLVQQFVGDVERPNGVTESFKVCVVMKFRDGLLISLDEYIAPIAAA